MTAYEPRQAVRSLLTENIIANRVDGWTNVHRLAAGHRACSSPIWLDRRNSGGASLARDCVEEPGGYEDVDVVSLDKHMKADAAWPQPRIDLIKVDVQGYEDRVLAGASDILVRDRPIVSFEYNPLQLAAANSFGPDLLSRLDELDYELYVADEHDGTLLKRTAAGLYRCCLEEKPMSLMYVITHVSRPWRARESVCWSAPSSVPQRRYRGMWEALDRSGSAIVARIALGCFGTAYRRADRGHLLRRAGQHFWRGPGAVHAVLKSSVSRLMRDRLTDGSYVPMPPLRGSYPAAQRGGHDAATSPYPPSGAEAPRPERVDQMNGPRPVALVIDPSGELQFTLVGIADWLLFSEPKSTERERAVGLGAEVAGSFKASRCAAGSRAPPVPLRQMRGSAGAVGGAPGRPDRERDRGRRRGPRRNVVRAAPARQPLSHRATRSVRPALSRQRRSPARRRCCRQ